MNVRYKLTLWVGVAFVLFLSACVKSDPDDCVSVPKGIDVYFYSLSPCQTDTVYPVDITDLMVGVFDQEGILVTHSKQANVELEKEFFRQLEVSSGLYTVVACSGLGDDSFQVEEWKDGVTTKKMFYSGSKEPVAMLILCVIKRSFMGKARLSMWRKTRIRMLLLKKQRLICRK